eukprot:CAMPEP_0113576058 /NCGR_PEP_ID=MMETSP0015_2-20120614/28069_1 /TAXON_ID=2838 /ORGANISM="Odontella" /LENGTH=312 /DNA_ID=CAMNT_0000479419 /DNA_START=174 /DNA_END=1109 /DNA_ORIENTATION=- /assembly_acc=CAM_ASM_000160
MGFLRTHTDGASSINSRRAPWSVTGFFSGALQRTRPSPKFYCSSSSYHHSSFQAFNNNNNANSDNTFCTDDYVREVYEHFRTREVGECARPTYMKHQPVVNEWTRSVLIEWLLTVHTGSNLDAETLYLTVNLFDRFLEKREIRRSQLKLVGATCFFIASKYEDIYPPKICDIINVCDCEYSKEEIIDMERSILEALQYKMTISTANAFLAMYLKASNADEYAKDMARYILDGTLQSYSLLCYLPSELAAASFLIARNCVFGDDWRQWTLLECTGYCEEKVIPVARDILMEKSSAPPELCAVDKKYGTDTTVW